MVDNGAFTVGAAELVDIEDEHRQPGRWGRRAGTGKRPDRVALPGQRASGEHDLREHPGVIADARWRWEARLDPTRLERYPRAGHLDSGAGRVPPIRQRAAVASQHGLHDLDLVGGGLEERHVCIGEDETVGVGGHAEVRSKRTIRGGTRKLSSGSGPGW